jgi:hypothetical protein
MGKLTAEQKVREYNRAREGRSRSWSEPWAYPFESNQHYEERREAFNQVYGIIDARPCLSGAPLRNNDKPARVQAPNVGRQRPKGFNGLMLRDAADGRSSG